MALSRVGLAVLLAGSLFAPLAAGIPQRSDVRFSAGEPFPDIVLPSLEDDSPTSISRFRGKKIILHVFASW